MSDLKKRDIINSENSNESSSSEFFLSDTNEGLKKSSAEITFVLWNGLLASVIVILLITNWNNEESVLVKIWCILHIIIIIIVVISIRYIFDITNTRVYTKILIINMCINVFNSSVCYTGYTTTKGLQIIVMFMTILYYIITTVNIAILCSEKKTNNEHCDQQLNSI